MKIKKMLAIPASIALAIPLMAGCPAENQANPSSIPDGSTQLTKNMLGFWDAPGGLKCRWWIQSSTGSIGDNGNTHKNAKGTRVQNKGPAADQSQTMLVGTGKVGLYLKSDNCGPWTHQ